jgi:hypothetical protein
MQQVELASTVIAAADAERLATIALGGIGREYPSHIVHLMNSDQDAAPPRVLHPAFFGCFDWHSAVHTHWMLLRLIRRFDRLAARLSIEQALATCFTRGKLAAEAAYLQSPGRQGFERPYGLAWLLRLDAELAAADVAGVATWRAALAPLVGVAREHLLAWLPRLKYPVRSGTHNQTAFALALLLESAAVTADRELDAVVRARALELFAHDRNAPLAYEPSGEDFLSPCLMQAHLLARLLAPGPYGDWLREFLPGIPTRPDIKWLHCAEVVDETDGRLVHLHGLNLSRAWNLGVIAAALPDGDARRPVLIAAREGHLAAGFRAALAAEHYAGSHWLPTFAVLAGTADTPAIG